MDAFREED